MAVLGDPFAVSLHSVTRHPPPPGGKVLVYGGGALGSCATAIVRALYPDVEVMVVARFPAQAALARRLGATVVDPFPVEQLLEEAAAWSGGVLQKFDGGAPADGAPGWLRRRLRHGRARRRRPRSASACSRQRGTMVKSGVHAPERWEWSPLYFKEISWVGSNAFGVEEVDGVRMHGIAHYLRLADEGRVDMTGLLTHTFRLDQWREAFIVLADAGAERRHQGRLRLSLRPAAAAGSRHQAGRHDGAASSRMTLRRRSGSVAAGGRATRAPP